MDRARIQKFIGIMPEDLCRRHPRRPVLGDLKSRARRWISREGALAARRRTSAIRKDLQAVAIHLGTRQIII